MWPGNNKLPHGHNSFEVTAYHIMSAQRERTPTQLKTNENDTEKETDNPTA